MKWLAGCKKQDRSQRAGLCWKDSSLFMTFKTKGISWIQSNKKINTTTIMISLFSSWCLIMRRRTPRGQPSSIWCALNATCSANLCKYLPNIIVDVSPNININSNKCSVCRSYKIFAYINRASDPQLTTNMFQYINIKYFYLQMTANITQE